MRGFFLSFVFLITSSTLWCKKVAILSEINNPGFDIKVDGSRLYVPEGHQIFIYSLKDYKLVKKFGRKGEGPKEFRGEIYLNVQPECLLVESEGKISYFTKDGKYIREIVRPEKGRIKGMAPLGKRFVGKGTSFTDPKDKVRYNTISFYDSEFKESSQITKTRSRFQTDGSVMFMNGTFNFKVFNSNIYVQYHGKEYRLDCFDQNGKLKYSITDEKFRNRKVTYLDRKRAFDYLKKYMPWVYRQKERVKFPDFWGGVGTFFIDSKRNRLYIITYIKKDNTRSLFYMYDLEGNFIKKFFLAVGDRSIWAPYPLDIEDGKLYQLMENIDREEWELHITPLK